MIADQDLYRISSWASWVALVALVIAAVTITLFFAGAGAFWGPLNDVFDVVVLVALVFPVLAIDRLAGPAAQPWLKIVTVAAIAGLILAAAGEPPRQRPRSIGRSRGESVTPGMRPRLAIGRPSISLMSPVKSIGVAPLMYDPTANESTWALSSLK